LGLTVAAALIAFAATSFDLLYRTGMIGLVLFFVIIGIFISLISFVRLKEHDAQKRLLAEGRTVHDY
jgi:heme/copper-type cytochrome/quinol oxidase subunit 4